MKHTYSDRRRVSEFVLAEVGEGGRLYKWENGAWILKPTQNKPNSRAIHHLDVFGSRIYGVCGTEIDVIQEPVEPSVETCETECRRV